MLCSMHTYAGGRRRHVRIGGGLYAVYRNAAVLLHYPVIELTTGSTLRE